jgi:hypothetical protein
LLLHLDHHAVDLAAKVAVEDERRDGDYKTKRGVVQRRRNTVRQFLGVGAAGGCLRAEDLDHADHRAKQTHQWRRRRNGANCVQKALEFVSHTAPGLFDRFLHDFA